MYLATKPHLLEAVGGERYHDGWNWRQICNDLDFAISEPCSGLVTQDGFALTSEGKAVSRQDCLHMGIPCYRLFNQRWSAGLLEGISCQKQTT